ncbi:T9SS type A sorting domain-containing protein [Saccharicrinis aurantiacus]|uniref:T9SS type A sorting domain-containing protein n=1 Tax=Saccharicrinis aurantiacus TaxID=1849719 RepID=UPI0024926008|nr:T9SS type A sorting domain-containing protein [Saccharicrinis aurantiacus]
MKSLNLVLLLFVLSIRVLANEPDSLVFKVVQDNTIIQLANEESSSLSNSLGHIFTGRTRQDPGDLATISIRRGLVQFDIESLPTEVPNYVIDSVKVRLYFDRTSGDPANITLHRVLNGWTEGASYFYGGIGAPSQDGDVSWYYRSYSNSKWDNPGGDFESKVSATAEVGTSDDYGFIYWEDDALIDDVSYWLANPSKNFGWLLKGNEIQSGGGTAKRFYSKDLNDDNSDNVPTLIVYYSTSVSTLNPSKTSSEFKIYPNPVIDHLCVASGIEDQSVINIFNINGQLVYTNTVSDKLANIDVSFLASGTYILQMLYQNQVKTQRFIKQ